MKRIGLAVMGAMLLGAVTAASQGVRYGVGAGLLLPVGDYHSLDNAGWIAGADVMYWLPSASLAVRVELSYSRTSERPGSCCLTDHKTTFAGGMVDVVYAFGRTADQVRPYVLAGVGLYNMRLSAPRGSPRHPTLRSGSGAAQVWPTEWGGGAPASSSKARSPT